MSKSASDKKLFGSQTVGKIAHAQIGGPQLRPVHLVAVAVVGFVLLVLFAYGYTGDFVTAMKLSLVFMAVIFGVVLSHRIFSPKQGFSVRRRPNGS